MHTTLVLRFNLWNGISFPEWKSLKFIYKWSSQTEHWSDGQRIYLWNYKFRDVASVLPDMPVIFY